MKKILTIISLFLICTSCATPTVVNIIGPNDSTLNCKELSSEIAKANQYADEAQAALKIGTPHNIAAMIFFFPSYGVTMANVDIARTAANNRTLHLTKLKEKKNC